MTKRRSDLRLTDHKVGGWKFSKVNNIMNLKFPKIERKKRKVSIPSEEL